MLQNHIPLGHSNSAKGAPAPASTRGGASTGSAPSARNFEGAVGTALAAKRSKPRQPLHRMSAGAPSRSKLGNQKSVPDLEVADACEGECGKLPSTPSGVAPGGSQEFSSVLPGAVAAPTESGPARVDSQESVAESAHEGPSAQSPRETLNIQAQKKCKRLEKFLETYKDAVSVSNPSPDHPLAVGVAAKMTVLYERWMALEEPRRTGWLARFVSSHRFEFLSGMAIFAHSDFSSWVMEGQVRRRDSGMFLGDAGETVFLLLFTLELVARLCVHWLHFFVNEDMGWNWLDFVLVFSSLLSKLLIACDEEDLGVFIIARPLRIFRIAKVSRVFKDFRFLKQLRVVALSLVGSCKSLAWPLVMLVLILYIFSTFFVQQMALHIEECGGESLSDEQLQKFGSVSAGMLTLGMCTTGGTDWGDVYELVEPLGTHLAAALLFYIGFYTFGAMNIITGIFVESALRVDDDEEEKLQEVQQKLREDAAELSCLLSAMDTNGDGFLAMEEFIEAMQDDRFIHVLSRLGLTIKDSKLFFMTVACMSQHDVVSIPEFVDLVVRMRGPASSADLNSLILKTSLLSRSVSEWREESSELMNELLRHASPPAKPVALQELGSSGLGNIVPRKRAALFEAVQRATSMCVMRDASFQSGN